MCDNFIIIFFVLSFCFVVIVARLPVLGDCMSSTGFFLLLFMPSFEDKIINYNQKKAADAVPIMSIAKQAANKRERRDTSKESGRDRGKKKKKKPIRLSESMVHHIVSVTLHAHSPPMAPAKKRSLLRREVIHWRYRTPPRRPSARSAASSDIVAPPKNTTSVYEGGLS